MHDEKFKRLIIIILSLGFLSICLSLLLAVINLGTQLASTALLIVLQICLAFLFIIVVGGICMYLIEKIWAHIVREIAAINQRHADLLKSMKKRAPWFVTFTLLASQAVLVIADKSFDGNNTVTVTVTIALIVLFFLANEFFSCERPAFKLAGYALWVMTAASLPLLVFIYSECDLKQAVANITAIPIHYQYIFTLLMVTFIAAPFIGSLGRR